MTSLLLTLLTYGASQEPHYFAQFWQYRVEVSVASLKEPCNESFKLISADVPYRNERHYKRHNRTAVAQYTMQSLGSAS